MVLVRRCWWEEEVEPFSFLPVSKKALSLHGVTLDDWCSVVRSTLDLCDGGHLCVKKCAL